MGANFLEALEQEMSMSQNRIKEALQSLIETCEDSLGIVRLEMIRREFRDKDLTETNE